MTISTLHRQNLDFFDNFDKTLHPFDRLSTKPCLASTKPCILSIKHCIVSTECRREELILGPGKSWHLKNEHWSERSRIKSEPRCRTLNMEKNLILRFYAFSETAKFGLYIPSLVRKHSKNRIFWIFLIFVEFSMCVEISRVSKISRFKNYMV